MIKTLFIDTDIGGDCDDAGALALANIFRNNKAVDIAGMTFTTSAEYGAACIDAINTYYGNGDIEIGATRRKNYCDTNVNPFQEAVAKGFPNSVYDKRSGRLRPVPEATAFIRKTLSSLPDKSLTFVCIGQLNNVSDLLETAGDDFSPLSGVELVRAKIKEFVVMGGLFSDAPVIYNKQPYITEYNIACDVKSAVNFVNKCPVKIVFSDFKVGYSIKTGASLLALKKAHPVAEAYRIFQNAPRESWDLLTVWYAAFGCDGMFGISDEGDVKIEADGETFFDTQKKNNRYILKLADSEQHIADRLENTLEKEEIYVGEKV